MPKSFWVCCINFDSTPHSVQVFGTRKEALLHAITIAEDYTTEMWSLPYLKKSFSKHYKAKIKKWFTASRESLHSTGTVSPLKTPMLRVQCAADTYRPHLSLGWGDGFPTIHVMKTTQETNPLAA